MRKLALFLALLSILAFYPCQSLAKTLTIAVIDTGVDAASNNKLCKFGHKSFVSEPHIVPLAPYIKVSTTPQYADDPLHDAHGHGTHIAGLISQEAGDLDYCIVSIKFYDDRQTGKQNLSNMVKALRYVRNIKVDFVNISGGGPEFDEAEFLEIKSLLKAKTTIVAAAGNEKDDLDKSCNYFPACYDKKIVMVGNLEITKDFRGLSDDWKFLGMLAGMGNKIGTYETGKSSSSNYGKRVSRWEIGTNLKSTLPGGKTGYMSGTSQATAVATGKLVKQRLSK